MTSERDLRRRWTPERAADAKEALENWKKPQRLERVAWGMHDGRLDLRGLPIFTDVGGVGSRRASAKGVERDQTYVTLEQPPEYHDVKWTSIDLSHAEIDHFRLFLSELRDCRFVGATMRDWRSWGTSYTDCDFSGADLQNANIGGAPHRGRNVEYTRCTWRRGKFRAASLSDGWYRDCVFDDVALAKEQLIAARFHGCSFSGRLEEMRFDGRDIDSALPWDVRPEAMVECDFSGCDLSYVEFLGIDMRTVTLPPQGRRIPHVAVAARKAYDWANAADIGQNEKRFLQMYWNGHVTRLPEDAEGWIDVGSLQEAARTLIAESLDPQG